MEKLSKITILGSGRWGTTLAWYLDLIQNKILVWGQDKREIDGLVAMRQNQYVRLPKRIEITMDLEKAIDRSELIIIAILSQGMRELCQKISEFKPKGKTILIATKGIEEKTGLTMSQVAREVFGNNVKVAVLAGPAFPETIVRKKRTWLVIANQDKTLSTKLAQIFTSQFLKINISEDLIGVELGAAAKNVVSVLNGICDGLSEENLRAVLVTSSLREIIELGKKMRAKKETFLGLAYFGDLFLTSSSIHSKNRTAGQLIAKGRKVKNIPFVAEGIASSRSLHFLSKKLNVEMPTFETVYKIIFKNISRQKALDEVWRYYSKYYNSL
jgi:glycerol-3-phosphate dehydrogenase (NAD(P)+)